MTTRITKLKNESDQPLTVHHVDGKISSVPPKGTMENVSVTNIDELKDRATVTMDLGEVQEGRHGSGRTQLLD